MIVLSETDAWWTQQLEVLHQSHPHVISRPQENGYGMNLFSRFPLHRPKVRFPSDHLFHSDHFGLVDLRLLNSIGSDHFPVLVVLRLQEDAEVEQEAPAKKPSDEREADEIVEEEMTEKE